MNGVHLIASTLGRIISSALLVNVSVDCIVIHVTLQFHQTTRIISVSYSASRQLSVMMRFREPLATGSTINIIDIWLMEAKTVLTYRTIVLCDRMSNLPLQTDLYQPRLYGLDNSAVVKCV